MLDCVLVLVLVNCVICYLLYEKASSITNHIGCRKAVFVVL
jgi:hypothetical protein